MVRSSAAAILACLYAAGSIWLVQSQGRAYRDALHRERLAAVGAEATSPRPIEPEVATAPEPASPGGEPTITVPPASVGTSPPVGSAGRESPPNPASPPLPDRAPGAIAAKVPDPAPPPKLDPIWDQAPVKKIWDVANLSIADEVQIGRDFSDLVLTLIHPVQDVSLQRRVEQAAKPFLTNLRRPEIRYTFKILDSDAVNAFSTPGGFVYVCRGLFNLIGEDEDYALEFVVGHEIAHVDRKHAIKCLQDPDVMKMTGGTLQKLYMPIIPFAFLDDQEYEADRWAYGQMRQFGRTQRESLAFLRKFEGYATARGFPLDRGKPEPGGNRALVENHFRAHTAAFRRLDHLKELIAKAANAPK
jgi:Peptidase family M48